MDHYRTSVEAVQQYLSAKIGELVYLRVEVVPIKILEFEFPRRAAQGEGGKGEPKQKTLAAPSQTPKKSR